MIDPAIWNTIVFTIFILFFTFIIIVALADYRKKRKIEKKPLVSIIVPTYNDAGTLGKTIESVFDSYDNNLIDLIVVNDGSDSETDRILKDYRTRFSFKVIKNEKNIGKVRSINRAFDLTKGNIILVLDSDTILNSKAMEDMLSRLQEEHVGATSCRYKPINRGFLARMQEIEYGMISLIQTAYNAKTTMSLWGGCMAFKRKAFTEVSMLTEHALIEDMDLALKLGRSGWKVEEASSFVYSSVPTKLKEWFLQKLRWGAGGIQNVLRHFPFFIFHPVFLFFTFTYTLLTVSFAIALFHNILFFENMFRLFRYFRDLGYSVITTFGLMKLTAGFHLFKAIFIYLLYPVFSIPYALINMESKREWYKVLLVIPFSAVYFPIFLVVAIISYAMGIYKFFTLKEGQRAW